MQSRDETDIQVLEMNLQASGETLTLKCGGCRVVLLSTEDIKGFAKRVEVNSPFIIEYLLIEWVTG